MKKKLLALLRARGNLHSNIGQGILEYILVLFVVVLVMLGMIYQLNTAFAGFLDNYFGSYLACLIETGELPSLGGESITAGECEALFQPFSLSNGRPLIEDTTTTDGEGGGGGRGAGGRRRGGRSSRYGGSANAEGASEFLRRPNQQTVRLGGGGTRKEAESAPSSEEGGGFGRRTTRIIRRRSQIPFDFIIGANRTKRKASRKVASAKKKDFEALRIAKGKYKGKKDEDKGASPEPDPSLNLTFSNILKWMIILGIIMALAVFFGGQIAQIRKSWEKGE